MARSLSIVFLSVAIVLAASPAGAQFGSIFGGDDPPRPPGSVPGRRVAPAPEPRGYPERDYPDRDYPARGYPDRNDPDSYPPDNYPPENYPRAPQPIYPQNSPQGYPQQGYPERLPPGPPPNSRIQSQPLPPPPGSANAPQSAPANAPAAAPAAQPPSQPQPSAPATNQRPPAGAPASTAPQPGDEIVTEPPAQKVVNPTAVFSGLDKITGRITTFEVSINETVRFGALEVTPRACYTRPPTETANTDGFIEIDEVTLQGELRRIFTGWMYAASPGLNAVQHPIYDVWLTDCKGAAPPAVTAEAPETPAPPPARRAPPPRRAAPAQQLPPPPPPLR